LFLKVENDEFDGQTLVFKITPKEDKIIQNEIKNMNETLIIQ